MGNSSGIEEKSFLNGLKTGKAKGAAAASHSRSNGEIRVYSSWPTVTQRKKDWKPEYWKDSFMNGYADGKRKYSRQMYGYLEIINTEVLSMWGKLK